MSTKADAETKSICVGHADQPIGFRRKLLRESAEGSRRDHTVARLEACDALAHFLDHARDFATRRERRLGLELIFALDDQRVREIDTGSLHADDHLPLARPSARAHPLPPASPADRVLCTALLSSAHA